MLRCTLTDVTVYEPLGGDTAGHRPGAGSLQFGTKLGDVDVTVEEADCKMLTITSSQR